MKIKNLCIVPAKGGSTRFEKKNMALFLGVPLVAHTIKKALVSGVFDKVVVSTEDKKIADLAIKLGAEVPFVRPEELAKDPATIIDVVKHLVKFLESNGDSVEVMTILLPTCPLLLPKHLIEASSKFANSEAEGLVSVTTFEVPPFNAYVVSGGYIRPCFPDSEYRYTKSTECPLTYRSNGGILMLNNQILQEDTDYRNGNLIPYEMEKYYSIDVDFEDELEYAEFLVTKGKVEYPMEIFNE